MKKLLIILLILPFLAQAENIIQFRNGNYAYAENGKLTFNLEPNLFENRSWKYDEKTKSFNTQFSTNKITLKTQHASKWYFYDSTYVVYQQNHSNKYLLQPVYKHNQNQFTYQKTFWPAAGWLVRVGGRIIAEVAPPIIRKCMTNAKCISLVVPTVAWACAINYGWTKEQSFIQLPAGVCSKIEEDGYERDEKGNYRKEVQYEVNYVSAYKSGSPVYDKKGFKNLDSAINFAKEKAKWLEEFGGRKCDEVEVKKNSETRWTAKCGYSSVEVYKLSEVKEKDLVFVDLQNYIFEDMKKNPNPYINSKSDLGKDLRNAIQTNKADVALNAIENGKNPDLTLNPANGSGLFTAVSDPYRDVNGETKQDIVIIQSPTQSQNATLSGSLGQGSSGGSGVSDTKNKISFLSKPRPDKEGEAGVGENNGKDGSSSGGSSGSGNSSGDGNQNGEGAKKICETNPKSIACMQAGEVENSSDNPFSSAIKAVQEDGTKFGEQNILPKTGICPGPKSFTVMGKSYEMSYYWVCEFSSKIRGLIIALAAVVAGFIIFGTRKG